jgi:transposase
VDVYAFFMPSDSRSRQTNGAGLLSSFLRSTNAVFNSPFHRILSKYQKFKDEIARLQRDSTTSNRPPSSDLPAKKSERPRKTGSGRKRGGQKGHVGAHRPVVPPERVDRPVEYKPDHCAQCAQPFAVDAPATLVETHQVWEIPPVKPIIEEHRFFACACPCGHCTRARVPQWIYSGCGEQAQALIAYLTGSARLARRTVQQLFDELFSFPIALGTIQNRLEDNSAIFAPTVDELEQALPHQDCLNIDETSYPHNRSLAWLWAFVTAHFAVFVINPARSSKVLRQLLGIQYAGVITCDRFSAYIKYQKDRLAGLIQFCWAHILRDIKALNFAADLLSQRPFALLARRHVGAIFGFWHAFKQGKISRQLLIDKTRRPINRLRALCEGNLNHPTKTVRTLCTSLLKHWPRLFTFLEHEGVEPTNNEAERRLRPGVQTRKISYCTRSQQGQLLRARLLTITATCRMQGRNSLRFFRDAIHAHRHGLSPPSLLLPPSQETRDQNAA